MKDFFKKYLSDEDWLIKEDVWDPHFQSTHETLFTLGNGYLGSRGILEEIPYDTYPGTYIAGVYDTSVAQVSELVNLPNPLDFRIVAEGEKVDMIAMDVVKHKRAIDMKKGLLWRRTVFSNTRKEKFDYQSLRFFSMDNPHVGAMQIYFTPLDKPIDILVRNEINTAITNKGILTEGRKNHIRIIRVATSKKTNYICVRTVESKISVAYADYLKVSYGREYFAMPDRAFRLRIDKGKTICFTYTYSIFTSRDITLGRLKGYAIRSLRKAVKMGFNDILKNHIKAWDAKWQQADIIIRPDSALQRVLRFNIYHLLISGSEHSSDASIGARTLSGEGYRGHIFWDTEIYILPFFIYNFPEIARNMLYYRYNRLDAARWVAKENGFKGALFPWESAREGIDVTPGWHKSLDGRIIKIYTGQLEHHIVSDIAYAVYHYFLATGDEKFMLGVGLELMFETARFWASRVGYDKKKDSYHIKNVIGPDEFHEKVDDNAYTNVMAKFNLMKAAYLYEVYKKKYPKILNQLIKKINLSEKEVKKWQKVAGKILILFNRKNNLIEAFDGYFRKKDIPITDLDNNFMPLLPRKISFKDLGKTQFIKQADVVMLLYLLSEDLNAEEKRDNFLYYEKRTLHKSSLSTSIHALVASDVGEFEKARRYFLYSLYGDLRALYGNIGDGVHAASLGGVWQALIMGFCGARMRGGILSFNPNLPPFLKQVKFKIKYRDFNLIISVYGERIEIIPEPQGKTTVLNLSVYGIPQELRFDRKHIFKKGRVIRPC